VLPGELSPILELRYLLLVCCQRGDAAGDKAGFCTDTVIHIAPQAQRFDDQG